MPIEFQVYKSVNVDEGQIFNVSQLISIGSLTFEYINNNNEFKIDTNFQTPSNKLQLSLVQIFIWKCKQKYFLENIELTFIFIQDFIDNDMSKLWANLGGLSAHMGFDVQSIQQKENHDQQVIADQYQLIQEFIFHEDIDIYHQSLYPSFDTVQANLEGFRFQMSIKKDLILYQILLTKVALNCQKNQPHLTPIIFALNAISLELYLIKIDKGPFSEHMIKQSEQIYDTSVIPDKFVNVFHLPVHLIQIFQNEKHDDKYKNYCQMEFQQMCDISYYNKVEFMCLARNFYREENSVMSFSSRSGKSTTLYSLYYYDLFSQKFAPIYLNLTPNADEQPLYGRQSFEYDVIDLISSKGGVEYFNYYYNQINTVLQAINRSAFWSQNRLQDIIGKKDIHLDKVSIEINNQLFESLTAQQIFQGLLQLQLFQSQLNDKTAIIEKQNYKQYEQLFNHWLFQYDVKQDTKINKIGSRNEITKHINLYIDECLSKQKQSYNDCLKVVSYNCKDFRENIQKFISKHATFDDIFNIIDVDINSTEQTIKDIDIKSWCKILSYKSKITNISVQNKQDLIQQFNEQNVYIKTEATDEQKFYVLLNYWHVYYNNKLITKSSQIAFIDDFIVKSPQFVNIKVRKDIFFHLFQQINDLKIDQFSHQLDNVLFQFFLSLYNPRGIETMFWKNIQYYLSNVLVKAKRLKSFLFSQQQYQGRKTCEHSNKYIEIFSLDQSDKIHLKNSENINVKNRILVAGTDFSLVNFVRQNQLCYSTESSRLLQDYIQTSIVSPAQPHPQALNQFYYQMQRVSLTNFDTFNTQILKSIELLKFHQYYIHMLPEKASEMQILCALLSPQIMFKITGIQNKATSFLLNKSQKFQSFKTINNHSISLVHYQMHQYKLISNQISLARTQQNIEKQTKVNNIKVKSSYQEIFEFDVKDFHQHIVFIPSTIYNKEVTTLFNYEISKFFFHTKDLDDLTTYLNDEQKIFQWDSLNECNSILIFILALTGNKAVSTFKLIRDQTGQSLYLSMNKIVDTRSIDIPADKLWQNMQEVCHRMKFMFLQQSYDEWLLENKKNESEAQRIENRKTYLTQSTDLAIESFKILLAHKKFDVDKQQLAIISVIDKQLLQDSFAISDYMLTIISSKQNILDNCLFENRYFILEGVHYYTYQVFIEYGNHQSKDLGNKIFDSNIKGILQLGLNQTSILLNKESDKPLNESLIEDVKKQQVKHIKKDDSYLLKDLQGFNKNLKLEEQKQIIYHWISNQLYLVTYLNIFKQVNFDSPILNNIFTDLFNYYIEEQLQKIIDEATFNNYPIVIFNIVTKVERNLVSYPTISLIIDSLSNEVILEYKITDSNKILLVVISSDDLDKLIEKDNTNTTDQQIQSPKQIIYKWIENQVQVVEYNNKFSNLQLTDEIMKDINLDLFYNQLPISKQLQDIFKQVQKLPQYKQVDIELYDKNMTTDKNRLLKDIPIINLSVPWILKELGEYVILKYKFDEDLVRIILFVVSTSKLSAEQQDSSIVEEPVKSSLQTINSWFSNYQTKHPDDYENPLIKSYISAFKPDILTEEIAESADLNLFDSKMTVEMQIKHMIKQAIKAAKEQVEDFEAVFDENELQIAIREIGFKNNLKPFPINSTMPFIVKQLEGFALIKFGYNARFQILILQCIKIEK